MELRGFTKLNFCRVWVILLLSAVAQAQEPGTPVSSETQVSAHSTSNPTELSIFPPEVGAPSPDTASAVPHLRCDDLFAMQNGLPRPPAWIDPNDGPGAQFVRQYWSPGCSMVRIDNLRRRFPTESAETIFLRTRSAFESHDACAQPPQARRYRPGYVPPTQTELSLQNLMTGSTAEERERRRRTRQTFEVNVQSLINRTTDSCCGSGPSPCRESMNALQIHWCEPTTDPNVPDPCISTGTEFSLLDAEYQRLDEFYDQHRTAMAGRGHLPAPYLGRIRFSPYIDTQGALADSLYVASHEIGHACSYFRRMSEVQEGSVSAYEDVSAGRVRYRDDQPAEGCEIRPNTRQVYLRLLSALGEQNGVGPCLLDMALHAGRTLYRPGTCDGACPRQHLEEATADWLMLNSVSDENWIDAMLVKQCILGRDSEHGAVEEQMACFFKSARVQARARRVTGCQP